MTPADRRHARFRAVLARAIAKADREQAEHLEALRPRRPAQGTQGRRRGQPVVLGRPREARR